MACSNGCGRTAPGRPCTTSGWPPTWDRCRRPHPPPIRTDVTLDEIDRTLAGYRHVVEVMTANLFELENDTNRKLLDRAALTGVTATRWGEAGRSLAQLWQWFTQFKDVVDRATAVRGSKARVNPT